MPPTGRLPDTTPLSEVDPIRLVSKLDLEQLEIERVVELPLVAACQALWKKNVTTSLSSANREDLGSGRGALFIEYDLLSPENRAVAERLGEIRAVSDRQSREVYRTLIITIPVEWMDTVGSVSDRALAIADQFHHQPDRFPANLQS